MRASDGNHDGMDSPSRPFNGIFSTNHISATQFNLVIDGPRHGFTASQLRGVALLIDRCCDHPVATLTAQGALDLGAIDARWRTSVNAALVELHLTGDDDDDIDAVPRRMCTNPWNGTSISVDQLVCLARIMVEHSIDHVLFDNHRIARFDISRDTSVADFQTALCSIGLFHHGQMVCTS